ncbi:MAG TPA: glycosyltransferase family 4 protein [Pseudolabrys sp.]|jgi:UDP-N-acetylmuramyl pentapeptide phosphotransferase/UDP-N-acetylglucosamine-1-phosphate transferase|nr:glycosyltransferase family 4 protein [Pseudolabrys sp.]
MPLFRRYALAHPNARSSHRAPTPQGAGLAVVTATVAVSAAVIFWRGPSLEVWTVFLATILIAVVGAVDDMRSIGVVPRLALQAVAVLIVIAALPDALRVAPALPFFAERALMAVALLWFVNLANFMDGIDWMTVAEIVPVSAALVIAGVMGAVPGEQATVALVLCGAIVGFAPFNKPVARIFLGDVGSLPIGLLTGWLLIALAGNGHIAAALLLPLYYLADATITLLRRLAAKEKITQAHRSHFYQRALDGGLGVIEIVARVFLLNVALAVLALATLANPAPAMQIGALAVGCILTAAQLRRFSR